MGGTPFRSAAVLGAGVMGAQIAGHLANVGLTVDLLDMPAPDGPKNGTVEGLFQRACALKPPPFFTADVPARIRLGNFEEHWERLADVDWVIEVVVENMDIKRSVLERIESVVRDDAVISTNTSGLPIRELARDRSAGFRARLLGTHFFNPPRYMKLLELVPTEDTDPAVVERVRHFGRVHLGKGVVIAKDTPNFIANRVGVHAILQAVRKMEEGGYTIEEVDALTGPLIGHPKSATLRTCDVVGLDTLAHVANNLWEAVPDDESRDAFVVPSVLQELVDAGAVGAKAKRGFYKKEGRAILSWDTATKSYAESRPVDLELGAIAKAGGLDARLRALYEDGGRAGAFFRETTLDMLAYAARRIPEITDSPADLDRAICWGFGYELGPFATWDVLGFERVLADMRQAGLEVAPWVEEMERQGSHAFACENGGVRQAYAPVGGYAADDIPADEIQLGRVAADSKSVLWEGRDSRLLDLGEGVALYEFRSKANTLTTSVMDGLRHCIDLVESGSYAGLVIGNGAEHFSPGANLVEMVGAAEQGAFDVIDDMIARFQETVQRVHYASVPVVVATRGRVFGGACELLMACDNPVMAAESYVGLVELGAGLIPAGCGTMRMVQWAHRSAASDDPTHLGPWLRKAFETVGMVSVSASAAHAQQLGFASSRAAIVHNSDRHLFVAQRRVMELAEAGHLPPAERTPIRVLGEPARAQLEAGLDKLREAGRIDDYGVFLGGRLAYVMTGGERQGPADVGEQELLDLEREVFVSLLGEQGTKDRIAAIVGRTKG